MVEADQVKNGQSAAFLDVLKGLRGECDRNLAGIDGSFTDGCAVTEPLDVKPRRHDAPTPDRFLIPVLP